MILYWAYGSNLNIKAMRERCPGARPLAPLFVEDGALVFRSIADVVSRSGGTVPGGLWEISAQNERELDTYEGVRGGLYLKKYLLLKYKGKKQRCLYYQMTESRGVMPPGRYYYDTIVQGYKDFKLPLEPLYAALEEAWDEKKPTTQILNRYKRRGPLVRLEA
jgi:hypothetical protein